MYRTLVTLILLPLHRTLVKHSISQQSLKSIVFKSTFQTFDIADFPTNVQVCDATTVEERPKSWGHKNIFNYF